MLQQLKYHLFSEAEYKSARLRAPTFCHSGEETGRRGPTFFLMGRYANTGSQIRKSWRKSCRTERRIAARSAPFSQVFEKVRKSSAKSGVPALHRTFSRKPPPLRAAGEHTVLGGTPPPALQLNNTPNRLGSGASEAERD